jgi:CheY-like chemotaxis protein
MTIKPVCENCNGSFFLIDQNYKLSSFQLDPLTHPETFLCKAPAIGEEVEEMIAQRYKSSMPEILSKCFQGEFLCVEKRLPVAHSEDLIIQITFAPVHVEDCILYVVCTLTTSNRSTRQLKLLSEYSHVTSHELRAPITNILSLSNAANYHQIEGQDLSVVGQLLKEINEQAEKLDNIISTLNSLLHNNEHLVFFESGFVNPASKHIVLIDDDAITNRMHMMLIQKLDKEKKLVSFDHPEKAMDYIMESLPDLILLDLHMPGLDGWGFLQMMEAQKLITDVVIVSSSIGPVERSKAKDFPFVKDFLTKPLTAEKIKAIFGH